MATIEVAGLRAKVNALEHEIDALRGELAEADDRRNHALDAMKECYEEKLAPNPACGHPMAFRVMETPSEAWKRASTTGKDANGVDQGEYSGQFYCTLCQEKEAAVAAALEKVASHIRKVADTPCFAFGQAAVHLLHEMANTILSQITPTQTSAQQELRSGQATVTRPAKEAGIGSTEPASPAQKERK